MKLRNKKTGEVGNLVLNINPNRESYSVLSTKNGDTLCGNAVIGDYDSLSELNDEWEDYEEPKAYYIGRCGTIEEFDPTNDIALTEMLKEIGNYFETKEEAEKAVRKLKAWKRLKDKGFKFNGETCDYKSDKHFGSVFFETDGYMLDVYEDTSEFYDDIDLIFGGEE